MLLDNLREIMNDLSAKVRISQWQLKDLQMKNEPTAIAVERSHRKFEKSAEVEQLPSGKPTSKPFFAEATAGKPVSGFFGTRHAHTPLLLRRIRHILERNLLFGVVSQFHAQDPGIAGVGDEEPAIRMSGDIAGMEKRHFIARRSTL